MQQAAPAGPEQVQAELQQLLSEFYSGAGGAERKAEIDQLLGNFKRQPGSWVHCQQFLGQTPQLVPTADGQYVLFFSVLVFEEFVKRYWAEAPASQKDPIRTFLFQCLAAHHAVLPPFLCTKLAKVNVDIAKRDWPHDYPDFLTRLTAALAGDERARRDAWVVLPLAALEAKLRSGQLARADVGAVCGFGALPASPSAVDARDGSRAGAAGEAAALVFCGALSLEAALELVDARHDALKGVSAKAVSVVGDVDVEDGLADASKHGELAVSHDLCPGVRVVSGSRDAGAEVVRHR